MDFCGPVIEQDIAMVIATNRAKSQTNERLFVFANDPRNFAQRRSIRSSLQEDSQHRIAKRPEEQQ